MRFEQARRSLMPLAEAQGILSDEDVFNVLVSALTARGLSADLVPTPRQMGRAASMSFAEHAGAVPHRAGRS